MVIKRVDLYTNTPIIAAKAPVIQARLTETKDLQIHLSIDLAKMRTGLYQKFYESALFAELVNKATSISKIETFASTDLLTIAFGRVDQETVALAENIVKDFSRVNSETLVAAEQFSLAIAKELLDAATSVDLITIHTNKLVLDVLTPTDDWAGIANIDDDQYIDFGKNSVEYLTIQESLIRDSAKVAVNTVLTVESRIAWMQDYWAFDYNATDYVGLSATI